MRWKYLFINDVPMLYPQSNVAKQMRISFWLDPRIIVDELKLKIQKTDIEATLRYIV